MIAGGEKTMVVTDDILVEVAFALPAQQVIIPLSVRPGTTVQTAILASRILQQFPEIDLAQNRIGIFGKLAQLNTVLRQHDRIEIYRSLIADPKEARRQRAASGKIASKSGAASIAK